MPRLHQTIFDEMPVDEMTQNAGRQNDSNLPKNVENERKLISNKKSEKCLFSTRLIKSWF